MSQFFIYIFFIQMTGPILFTIGFVSSLCVPALMQTWWTEPEPRYIIQVVMIGVEEVWVLQPLKEGYVPEDISNVFSSVSFPSGKPLEGVLTEAEITRLSDTTWTVEPTYQRSGPNRRLMDIYFSYKSRSTRRSLDVDSFFKYTKPSASDLLGDRVIYNEDGTPQSDVVNVLILLPERIRDVNPKMKIINNDLLNTESDWLYSSIMWTIVISISVAVVIELVVPDEMKEAISTAVQQKMTKAS